MSCDCEGHCETNPEFEAALTRGEALLSDPNVTMPKNLSDMIAFFAMSVSEDVTAEFLVKISETLELLSQAPLSVEERMALNVLGSAVLDGANRATAYYTK